MLIKIYLWSVNHKEFNTKYFLLVRYEGLIEISIFMSLLSFIIKRNLTEGK